MMTNIRKILKGPCENISIVTGVDEYSKKIDLLEHTLLLVNGAIYHKDLPDLYIHMIYSRRWSIEIFFRTMKTYLKIDHLISKNINGILIQIFSALMAYIILLMIQASLAVNAGIPEILRYMRHGIDLPFRPNCNYASESANI